MSLAFTIIRCDGPNGIEGRRCAALLTVPACEDATQFLTNRGWIGTTTPDKSKPVVHTCPGCRPKQAPAPPAVSA